jgi:hypothetical protein
MEDSTEAETEDTRGQISGAAEVGRIMRMRSHKGCQMVYFQTKNPNLGKFWRALD